MNHSGIIKKWLYLYRSEIKVFLLISLAVFCINLYFEGIYITLRYFVRLLYYLVWGVFLIQYANSNKEKRKTKLTLSFILIVIVALIFVCFFITWQILVIQTVWPICGIIYLNIFNWFNTRRGS